MFFKNALFYVFLKFLYVGLILGLVWLIFSAVIKISRKNLYVYNLLTFVYVLAFGFIFAVLCQKYYDYSFCWFGLFGQILGFLLVKFSIEFFWTIILKLLYNVFIKRKNENGKLITSKKA